MPKLKSTVRDLRDSIPAGGTTESCSCTCESPLFEWIRRLRWGQPCAIATSDRQWNNFWKCSGEIQVDIAMVQSNGGDMS